MEAERQHILTIFAKLGIDFTENVHEEVRTSLQAAKVRGTPLKCGVKALVCRTLENRFILVLVRADKKADLKRIAEIAGTKRISLASTDEVIQVTGCEPGSIPPFGHKNELETYADSDIFKENKVNFNIGLKTHSAEIAGKDLRKILGRISEF